MRTKVVPLLPDSIRYSETMEASPAELIEAVREQGFESIVAKRRDSSYKPGQRSAACQKMRILQRRDIVIGGYTSAGQSFDATLVGDYEGRALHTSPRCMGVLRRQSGFQTLPGTRNEDLPVQEPARGASRSVGRRTDGRGDGEMPLAETATGRDDRLSGTNGRESPATRDVLRAHQEFWRLEPS